MLIWVFLGDICGAKTLYVKDFITITARTGPATDYRIIGLLKTGDKVELVEKSGGWSLVRLGGDREGWVISRYLTEKVPSLLLVQKLKSKQKSDEELIGRLQEKYNELQEENKMVTAQLAGTRKNFNELKQGAAHYLSLKKDYENTKRMLEELQSSNKKLALENKVLKEAKKIKWFLSGAGVVFGGWVIGFIMGRSTRKKKSGLIFSLKE